MYFSRWYIDVCQAFPFGKQECACFGDYPRLFLEYSCSTQISLDFFLSFSVRFPHLRHHLNCFITLIVTCLQNYAMTAVISLRSRHFRRARENFFANVLFLTVFCKIDNASPTELRYINFLQFRKSNGCSHDG